MEDTQVNQSSLNLPDLDLELPLKQVAGSPPKGVKVLTNVHRAMVDTILANPTASCADLGDIYGYSAHWVNLTIQSPVFKRELERRRAEVINPIIIASTEERLQAVINRSLDVINEKLSKNPDQISDTLALRALEVSAKALGLGQATTTAVVVESNHLDNLAKRLVALRPRDTSNGVIYEADSKEINGSGGH